MVRKRPRRSTNQGICIVCLDATSCAVQYEPGCRGGLAPAAFRFGFDHLQVGCGQIAGCFDHRGTDEERVLA